MHGLQVFRDIFIPLNRRNRKGGINYGNYRNFGDSGSNCGGACSSICNRRWIDNCDTIRIAYHDIATD